jgi:uncharacterized membrane protein YhaH (DUF805 family)
VRRTRRQAKEHPVGFSEAVKAVLGKYADFSGRARRSEYWFWYLAFLLAYLVALIGSAISRPLGLLLVAVVLIGGLLPNLAVSVRRLHDTGKSGWMLLIGFIPVVGAILLIVWFATDSVPGDNQYGPSPKGIGGMAGGYGQPPMGYAEPPTA